MNGMLYSFIAYLKQQRPLVEHPNSLLVLSIILITGIIFSWISRKLKIPSEIGLILGGVVIGKYLLNIFSEEYFDAINPITNFAIGLFGLIIGSHLDYNRLHNAGKRIIWITFTDIVFTGGLCFSAMHFILRQPVEISVICAVIASATSPESIIHEVRKERAKGLLTKTILSGIALNNVIIITIFYFAYNYLLSHLNQEVDLLHQLLKPLIMILESVIIGGITGYLLIKLNKRKIKPSSFTGMVLVAILITVGISETFHFSSILSTLILGVILTNKSRYKNEIFDAFSEVEKSPGL
jgi:Kef-type K+ transport system membrane component KefB